MLQSTELHQQGQLPLFFIFKKDKAFCEASPILFTTLKLRHGGDSSYYSRSLHYAVGTRLKPPV